MIGVSHPLNPYTTFNDITAWRTIASLRRNAGCWRHVGGWTRYSSLGAALRSRERPAEPAALTFALCWSRPGAGPWGKHA